MRRNPFIDLLKSIHQWWVIRRANEEWRKKKARARYMKP